METGDNVEVTATVSEFIPGGANTGNLSITQLSGNPQVEVIGQADMASAVIPTVIGRSGRIPPNKMVISADEANPPINLQLSDDVEANLFDPAHDGINFYESLEGMLVTIEAPVAVSATRTFSKSSNEVMVLAIGYIR